MPNPQPVGHEFPVDRLAHRAAHPCVVQRLDALVDLEPRDRREILPSLRRRRQSRLLLEPRQIERLDVIGRGQLHLAGLQRQRAALAVRDEAEDDLVQIRQAGLPVILVARQADEVAALPFDELERAGADRRRVLRVGAVIRAGIDVLRHHRAARHREDQQEWRIGLLQREHRGQRVRRLRLLDLAEHAAGRARTASSGIPSPRRPRLPR